MNQTNNKQAEAVPVEPLVMPPHPDQPLVRDKHGVVRFRENVLVRYMLDHGGVSLNDLAMIDCSTEDRVQLAQLIG